jgi:hypothetical protein
MHVHVSIASAVAEGRARYLAESDLTSAEGFGRRFFTRDETDLGPRSAVYALAGTRRLGYGDIFEFVISLDSWLVFNSLGVDDGESMSAFEKAIRSGMLALLAGLRSGDVSWVAVIHLNTDRPHAHVLLRRHRTARKNVRPRAVEFVLSSTRRGRGLYVAGTFNNSLRALPYFAGILANVAEIRRARHARAAESAESAPAFLLFL